MALENLVHNDLGSPPSGSYFSLFSLLFNLYLLEPLNLHHDIQSLLLLNVVLLEHLVLLQLLVPDGDDLGKHHFHVHVLHVVVLLVQLLLRSREHAVGSLNLLPCQSHLARLLCSLVCRCFQELLFLDLGSSHRHRLVLLSITLLFICIYRPH